MTKSIWNKTLDELDKIAPNLWIFAVMKDGKLAGRITARRTQSAVNVAVNIYGFAGNKANTREVFGFVRMTGGGYDRVNSGIAEIFAGNKERLRDDYGVNFSATADWDIMNTWQKDFNSAGFSVVQII